MIYIYISIMTFVIKFLCKFTVMLAVALSSSVEAGSLERFKEVLEDGSLSDIKTYYKNNGDILHHKDLNIWLSLSSRYNALHIHTRGLLFPGAKSEAESNRLIQNEVSELIEINDFILPKIPKGQLSKINHVRSGNTGPAFSFYLYGFCKPENISKLKGNEIASQYIEYLGGKIYFEDIDLPYTFISLLTSSKDNKQNMAECVARFAHTFMTERQKSIMKDPKKFNALSKKLEEK